MSRRALVVQVFVASPSDVNDEREQLETLINEMNKIWSKTSGIVLQLIKWETDVYPAFGQDPQSVINSQIGDNYDIFVGILWSKFGTKTPRAESGTLEEFERAYARLKSGENKPEIMVYFKDAPLSPSKIDPTEIVKIQQFKESISARGGVYSMFEDSDSFQSSLRAHLSAIVQKFSTKSAAELPTGLPEPEIVANCVPAEDEDLGYLDFIERYDTVMSELAKTLDEINDATVNIGRDLAERSAEITKIHQQLDSKQAVRKIINLSSENMQTYAKILEHKVPLFSDLAGTGLEVLSNALALQSDFTVNPGDLESLQQGLLDLTVAIEGTRSPVMTLRDTVSQIPRIASEINRAKRVTVAQLDSFLTELSKIYHLVSNVQVAVKKMILDRAN